MDKRLLQATILTFALHLLAGLSTPSAQRTLQFQPFWMARRSPGASVVPLSKKMTGQIAQAVDSFAETAGRRSP